MGNVSRYTYDMQGKVLGATDAKGSATGYAYDDFACLAQTMTPIDGNLNNVVKYTYDPVADLTKQEMSIGNVSATRSPRRRAA